MLQKIKNCKPKVNERWQEPTVSKRNPQFEFYMLEELDGTPLKRKYAGNQVEKYFLHMPGVQQSFNYLTSANINEDNVAGDAED
jgi:hypothetical protein